MFLGETIQLFVFERLETSAAFPPWDDFEFWLRLQVYSIVYTRIFTAE